MVALAAPWGPWRRSWPCELPAHGSQSSAGPAPRPHPVNRNGPRSWAGSGVIRLGDYRQAARRVAKCGRVCAPTLEGGPGAHSDLGLAVVSRVSRIPARAPTAFLLYGFLVPSARSQGRLLLHKTGRKREERQAKVLCNEKRASEKEPRCPFCVTVLLPQDSTRNWWLDWMTSMALARPTVYNCLLYTVSPVTYLLWVCTCRLYAQDGGP